MKRVGTWKRIILLAFAAVWMFCMSAAADELSGDNSLYSLGLENGECSPEFYYSTLEYNVTVPAGTTELLLDPVTSDSNASIIDISGTQLDEDGNGTVYITVEAPNGAQVSYVLNVTSDGESQTAETTEAETEDAAAQQSEAERQQAESEEAARLAAAEKEQEEKINTLTSENAQLTDRLDVLMKVLYGLIAFAVILLFFIINQSLRNKDLKDDLKEARSEANMNNEFTRKERSMPNDYYYTSAPGRNPGMMNRTGAQRADATNNTQAAFGNASQRLSAQPMPGQAYAPVQDSAVSRKEQKKLDKAAKKAEKKPASRNAKQPTAQQPVQKAPQGTPAQQPTQRAPQGAPTQQVSQRTSQGAPTQQVSQRAPQGTPLQRPARAEQGSRAQQPVQRAPKQAKPAADEAPAVQQPVQEAPKPMSPEQEKMQQMLDIPVQATVEEPDVKLDLIDL